jgi:tetratricopeptide (TPR) repeat protein
MSRLAKWFFFTLLLILGGSQVVSSFSPQEPAVLIKDILEAYNERIVYKGLTISYPHHETVFPPEIIAPTFHWEDESSGSDAWLITIKFPDKKGRLNFLSRSPEWTPSDEEWETIKQRSRAKEAEVSILGVDPSDPKSILSGGRISIRTSQDEVGAPLFYREVNLPFIDAVKDPSLIRWRFGSISSKTQPPIVLQNLPVCGNCHSFSADGALLGMDVDYANEKGSYALVPIEEEMVLDKSKIITWSDYRREDGELTYGLLSQVSPDGRFVVSTVKDRSVFVAQDNLTFSQLFFPVKGILAVYDREKKTFEALPGADDERYVQSNPSWSPDGKYIVFTRSKAYELKTKGTQVLLSKEECREFLEGRETFLFDLYRIPFNGGKGGKAEPVKGASDNGKSNYFAKYSPAGKWIVFCQAKSFSLLQPDSELYIIPAEGGRARRMRCNTMRMNSWHSFSPNGRWLVFSSKENSAYTQLFLTHIDDKGRSTPPVLLDRLTAPDRAANIPEFVNIKPGAINGIEERFLDDLSFIRAANEFQVADDIYRAEQAYRKALEYNPQNSDALNGIGSVLGRRGLVEEAIQYFKQALEIDPNNLEAYHNMGLALTNQDKLYEALTYYEQALEIDPEHANTLCNMGLILSNQGRIDEAVARYKQAIKANPKHLVSHNNLGNLYSNQKKYDEAVNHYKEAIKLDRDYMDAHFNLAVTLLEAGRYDEAEIHFKEAIRLDPNFEPAQVGLSKALQLKKDKKKS